MRSSHPISRNVCSRTAFTVIGFSFPVVPHGKARIRTQMSAAHRREHLDKAIEAFTQVGRELGVISN
jgi:2-amino-3-ketobutyrate coenzyme A ligase (EC 2.3.1.29)